jgi:hypothetical protein
MSLAYERWPADLDKETAHFEDFARHHAGIVHPL